MGDRPRGIDFSAVDGRGGTDISATDVPGGPLLGGTNFVSHATTTPLLRASACNMLFCHVAGTGGCGTVGRGDAPRCRSLSPGCARTPGAAGAILSPRLRLVQNGERATTSQAPSRRRLPITPAILRQIQPPGTCQPATASYQETMLWAAATVCFFGFFCAG